MTEGSVRSYIAGIKDKRTARGSSMATRQFLKFSAPTQLAEIMGDNEAPAVETRQEEIAVPQQWLLEKLLDEKTRSDDLIAMLGYQLLDHYSYFQSRIRGERENLPTVYRLADQAKNLIEPNVSLFMILSSGGREALQRYQSIWMQRKDAWIPPGIETSRMNQIFRPNSLLP